MKKPRTRRTARTGRRALAVALGVGITHFALTVLVLRALLASQTGVHGPRVWVSAAVAVLGFPLFYLPFRPTLGGLVQAGWVVAGLNALLWAGAAAALVAFRWRRTRPRP